ncbi:lytic murein transglycosylase [Sulfurimonas gotlandica GD1]|jgi:soluble lytic murein transglycosylase|uniref:Lytic murein transglycosylase n=1 Tax=Sulfurimonas gotlandica (strain DSM 19862 / JCM 16533 / GD1) TaxID=929558 RepID=B6BJE7_SULGG|nr:lytic transglycosylase domain-containing protein [Sulfurimonas gotlandica]EDZ62766.1 lytic murein transglycosylase, putative [Sulfurimonas gotlandica GD1]EHP31193.1 lytic murein transglycosylase [Sulfurimonas gotlandica GD1]
MIKIFIPLLVILASLDANITLQDIDSKPPSRAKNFMIWQYLKQNISPEEADKAYSQVKGNSNKLFKLYAQKTDNEEVKKEISCMKEKDLLSIKDAKCLELAFSPYKTLALSKEQREKLSKMLTTKAKIELLKIQNEPYSQKAYSQYDANTVLSLFVSTTSTHRRENLNLHLSAEFINKISSSWKISQLVKIVIHDDKLNRLQLSLLNLEGEKLNSKTNFYLALNHLKHSNNTEALRYFNLSLLNAKHKIDVDKNYFWMYKITENRKYLDKLINSQDINMYTLYAHEIQNKNFNNYFSAVEINDEKAKKDIKNPFEWSHILEDINSASSQDKLYELSKSYMQKDMIPVQTIILEKAYKYGMHGYIMPYDKYLRDITRDEKALVYAIMRQESKLIPSALSRSYALGLMQLMPFVADAISKQVENPVKSYDEMFIPKNNINYALKHLEWMKKSLYHPLFMAYAYNGGMGFLRRHLKKGTFNSGKYEPFLSMELMANSESREYGKKVLANYVMYKKVMGEEVSILRLFDTLTHPKKTDRFRAQG